MHVDDPDQYFIRVHHQERIDFLVLHDGETFRGQQIGAHFRSVRIHHGVHGGCANIDPVI